MSATDAATSASGRREYVLGRADRSQKTLPYFIAKWGNYAEVRPAFSLVSKIPKPGIRDTVQGMSVASRMNLVARMNKLACRPAYMITLTYEDDSCGGVFHVEQPDKRCHEDKATMDIDLQERFEPNYLEPEVPSDPVLYPEMIDLRPIKRHLDAFLKVLKRHALDALWWMEFTRRGRPHFHLLLCDPIPKVSWQSVMRRGVETVVCQDMFFGRVISEAWIRIANQRNETFHRGGIMEQLRSPAGALRYVAKEACKRAQKAGGNAITGRMWGIPKSWEEREPDSRDMIFLEGTPKYSRIYDIRDGIPTIDSNAAMLWNCEPGETMVADPGGLFGCYPKAHKQRQGAPTSRQSNGIPSADASAPRKPGMPQTTVPREAKTQRQQNR